MGRRPQAAHAARGSPGPDPGPRWIRDRTTCDACDRCKEPAISVTGEVIDLRYSGKAPAHGGNTQAVLAADGFPLWVSEVEPGSVQRVSVAVHQHHGQPLPPRERGQCLG